MDMIKHCSTRIRVRKISKANYPYLILALFMTTLLLAPNLAPAQGFTSNSTSPLPNAEAEDSAVNAIGKFVSPYNQTELTDVIETPRFWDTPPSSGELMIINDKQILKPGLSDKVRLIVLLKEEPVSVYIIKTFVSGSRLSISQANIVQDYTNQINAIRRQVLTEMEKQGIKAKITGKFNYVLNGFAISTEMSNWPRIEKLPHVKAVYPDYELHLTLDESVPLIGAPQVWNVKDGAGDPVTGEWEFEQRLLTLELITLIRIWGVVLVRTVR